MPAIKAASPRCVWRMEGGQTAPTAVDPAVLKWGAGDPNHPLPHPVVTTGQALAQVLRPPFGVLISEEGDHNHSLPPPPRQRRRHTLSGIVGVMPPIAAGTRGDHNFHLPQPGEKEVFQGVLGLWPAPRGHMVMGDQGLAHLPQAGPVGALEGPGLQLALAGQARALRGDIGPQTHHWGKVAEVLVVLSREGQEPPVRRGSDVVPSSSSLLATVQA